MDDELRKYLKDLSRDGDSYAELLRVFDELTGQLKALKQQKSLESTLTRQNRLLADLHQVTLNMLNRRDLADLLQYIVDSASAIMDSPFAEILLKQGEQLVVCAVAAETQPALWDAPGPDEAQLTWRAYETRQPVFLDDYQLWPGKRKVFDEIGLRAIAELPILIGDRCIGVLSLARTKPDYPYTPEQVESCGILLQFIGVVLDNANLYNDALREIAERQRAEDALRMSEERYRTVLMMLTEGVLMYDRDGEILAANPAVNRILGMNVEQIMGRAPLNEGWRVFHPDGRPFRRADNPAEIALTTGQPQTDVVVGVERSDGSVTWISINAQPMFVSDDPQPAKVVVSFADITQRRQVEAQALELAAEHKRADVLSQFIKHASHEFRTPLAIMQTGLYLMNRTDDPAVKQAKAEQIEDQIARIGRLVSMLTAQSMLDSDSPMNEARVSLNHIVRDCGQTYTGLVSRRELTMTYTLDPFLPTIIGDADSLSEAFSQLIDNAIRYTPHGGQIALKTGFAGKIVIVEVRDTGSGISSDDMPRIFERFYRTDHAHTTPGFGLGLSIAEKIVERHGGHIEVESAVGVGSTFRVVLPID